MNTANAVYLEREELAGFQILPDASEAEKLHIFEWVAY